MSNFKFLSIFISNFVENPQNFAAVSNPPLCKRPLLTYPLSPFCGHPSYTALVDSGLRNSYMNFRPDMTKNVISRKPYAHVCEYAPNLIDFGP